MRELLVVIDYQNDFVTGALGNPAAAALEPGIAARVAAQLERGGRVLFTRDTHGTDYLNTREGRFLPVAHCIKGSQGWGLYGSLSQYETGVRDGVSIVDKPTFGCAALPAEAEALCGGAPDSIEICGVVTDICVVSNAVLLHSAFLNARVAVLKDLCAAATPEGHARALALLAGMGYEIVVLYEGEQHLARLLQPQEELKYIFVLPHSGMAQELTLPNAPCLFSSVDYEGRDIPTVRFYAEVGGKSDVAAV